MTTANELAAKIRAAVYAAINEYGAEHAKDVKYDVGPRVP
jgi:hypothetical protein